MEFGSGLPLGVAREGGRLGHHLVDVDPLVRCVPCDGHLEEILRWGIHILGFVVCKCHSSCSGRVIFICSCGSNVMSVRLEVARLVLVNVFLIAGRF